MKNKEYLGDSVYVEINEHDQIVLTTENGTGSPSNTIILDTEVMRALIEYLS